MVRNAAAAILALRRLAGANAMDHPAARDALSRFTGTRRRSEIVGRADGVTVVDDYAHHPTAIKTTLAGFREFWPGSRLIVDFMSHTYTRTAAMLREFAESFGAADILVLNDIYASARETNDRAVSGKTLYEATAAVRPNVYYEPDFDRAADRIESFARAGDVVVTMGAGNNAKIGVAVIERLRERERAAGASA
jgi:UDP-N-acetylmuramate--alanine ligase